MDKTVYLAGTTQWGGTPYFFECLVERETPKTWFLGGGHTSHLGHYYGSMRQVRKKDQDVFEDRGEAIKHVQKQIRFRITGFQNKIADLERFFGKAKEL